VNAEEGVGAVDASTPGMDSEPVKAALGGLTVPPSVPVMVSRPANDEDGVGAVPASVPVTGST
jgi:hypothetical protein